LTHSKKYASPSVASLGEIRPNLLSMEGWVSAEEAFSEDGSSIDLRPVKVSTISFVDLAGSERGSVAGQESAVERVRQTEVPSSPTRSHGSQETQ